MPFTAKSLGSYVEYDINIAIKGILLQKPITKHKSH
jgi:hypothetical protein